ncbi:MAG: glucuronate isomerase [Erysipelothrix sp.]|nr:glucuronate isomerase [Erysipelothrix sp.]
MKNFLDNDFLLSTKTAQDLYHNHAAKMPIYDFHNHLSAQEIYEDKKFKDITEAWLQFDHYKWRALRSNGVSEHFITGKASSYEKFEKWAETMPYLFGNPLYHWTHLELQRYFDIDTPLNKETSKMIFDECNLKLQNDDFSVRNILLKSNANTLCTTDDPCDDLRFHKALKDEGFEVKVLPTFRTDKIVNIQKDSFIPYLKQVSETVGYPIETYSDFERAIFERLEYFVEVGALFADHGLDQILYEDANLDEVSVIFLKGKNGEKLTQSEIAKYQGYVQNQMGKKYAENDMVMQLHIGPLRNNNTRMFNEIGPDTGFDSMQDKEVAQHLSNFLDSLDKTNELPKTILYNLNPKDNQVLSSMLGNFQDGVTPGKIQFGPGWWFNDHKTGMFEHLEVLASTGLVSRFVGMLTDSRSFLSFPRHEYFRRILCEFIGNIVENGEFPNDQKFLGEMVEDICYNNIVEYTKKK